MVCVLTLLAITVVVIYIGSGATSISSRPKKPSALPKFISVKGSGRSSLSAQIPAKPSQNEDDWEIMEIEGPSQPKSRASTPSRFFDARGNSCTAPKATPERKRKRADSLEEIATPRASRTLIRRWSGDLVDMAADKENEEIGAGSSNTTSRCTSPDTFSLLQDLSSPVQPDHTSRSKSPESVSGDLSSPVSTKKPTSRPQIHLSRALGVIDLEAGEDEHVPTPVPMLTYSTTDKRQTVVVDLKQVFSQDSVSEFGVSEGPWTPHDPPAPIAQVAVSKGTPDLDDAEYISDHEKQEVEAAKRQARVAQGWVAQYGFKAIKGRKVCFDIISHVDV